MQLCCVSTYSATLLRSPRCTEHNCFTIRVSPQQLAADPQSWTEVYAVLKGTSLFCYHRQEDVDANVEPAFTIAVNKVSEGSAAAA